MKNFDLLIEVANKLMSPSGCPWDREQTFASLQPYIVEEGAELMEAIDEGDDKDIIEELADLFYIIIFYCKVAEKEKRFTLENVIEYQREKLIRRHPHVFGDIELEDMDHLHNIWEGAKKEEKKERTSALDGIPKGLPLLARTQKVLSKLIRKGYLRHAESKTDEEEIGERLLEIVHQAESRGIHAESALRKAVAKREKAYRAHELSTAKS
jgi:MazG family protein